MSVEKIEKRKKVAFIFFFLTGFVMAFTHYCTFKLTGNKELGTFLVLVVISTFLFFYKKPDFD